MSLQQAHEKVATNTTNIAANTADIAANTAAIAAITTPTIQVCRVCLTTTDQTIASASTYTKILFNTVSFDPFSIWDATNFRVIPTVPGYYQVSYAADMQSSGLGFMLVGLFKNGTQVSLASFTNTPAVQSVGFGGDLFYCNGTDYLETFVYITGSAPRVVSANSFTDFLSVACVSPD